MSPPAPARCESPRTGKNHPVLTGDKTALRARNDGDIGVFEAELYADVAAADIDRADDAGIARLNCPGHYALLTAQQYRVAGPSNEG